MIERKKIVIGIAVCAIAVLGSNASRLQQEKVDGFLGYLFGNGINENRDKTQKVAIPKTKERERCQFGGKGAERNSKVMFKEIAWMGDSMSPNNEWFALLKTTSGSIDISGYVAVNENGKIHAIVPDKTVLTDEHSEFLFARKETIPGIIPRATYAGALRNTNEGFRLFDPNCFIVDEVFAHPDWPAGDNKEKITMKRDIKTRQWHPKQNATAKKQKKSQKGASQSKK